MSANLPGPVPADIAEALDLRAARLGRFASRLLYFETISSTNDVADRLAADGAVHGTVVMADAQASGRGRMGRTWFSPPGAGLYVSVVLRPEELENRTEAGEGRGGPPPPGVAVASTVSLTAGVALAEAVRTATGLPVEIKWPNDLVIQRRKLCGILAEASSAAGVVRHIILGYGVNLRPAAYPVEIAGRATSLEGELGRSVDRASVLAESLARLAEWLDPSAGGSGHARRGHGPSTADFGRMLEKWRELSPSSRGAAVEVMEAGGGWVEGRTAGIDADGALLVSVGESVRRVIAGEVRWT